MKKYLDWIIEHKVKTGLIVFGLFIFPLIVIHFLYKWITPHYLLQSDWDSGDLITYIAGFEAFIGTVFLGAVAVRQNEEAIGTSNKALRQDMQLRVYEKMPAIEVATKAPIEETR
jgi:hypothetical protein